jgi:SET domain-containing protein
MYPEIQMPDGRATRSPSLPHNTAGRRYQVRRSGVHGKGVFALRPIAKGETLMEYDGPIIKWKVALRQPPHDPDDPLHTFYFHLDGGKVIDGKYGTNAAKWINHSCDPNCEAEEDEGRVFIKTLRKIKPGEELNYDYGLVLDGRHTKKVKKEFACRCGSRKCRGTLLASKK